MKEIFDYCFPVFLFVFLFLFLVIFSACSCEQNDSETLTDQQIDLNVTENNIVYTFEVIENKDQYSGWGYVIYANAEKYIVQPHLPAVPGLKGFKSPEDAEKTARLVLEKIKIYGGLPSVSFNELDSIGIKW